MNSDTNLAFEMSNLCNAGPETRRWHCIDEDTLANTSQRLFAIVEDRLTRCRLCEGDKSQEGSESPDTFLLAVAAESAGKAQC